MKTIDECIIHKINELAKNNVSVHFVSCSETSISYFKKMNDYDGLYLNKEIIVDIDTPLWKLVFLHEYIHYKQCINNTKKWVVYCSYKETIDSVTKRNRPCYIDNVFKSTLLMEHECETKVLQLLEKEQQGNVKEKQDYIYKANLYFFYEWYRWKNDLSIKLKISDIYSTMKTILYHLPLVKNPLKLPKKEYDRFETQIKKELKK